MRWLALFGSILVVLTASVPEASAIGGWRSKRTRQELRLGTRRMGLPPRCSVMGSGAIDWWR